jgi:hypothetical protein
MNKGHHPQERQLACETLTRKACEQVEVAYIHPSPNESKDERKERLNKMKSSRNTKARKKKRDNMSNEDKIIFNAKRRLFYAIDQRHGEESRKQRRRERVRQSAQRRRKCEKKEAEIKKAAHQEAVRVAGRRKATKWTQMNNMKYKPTAFESKFTRDANLRQAIMMRETSGDKRAKKGEKKKTAAATQKQKQQKAVIDTATLAARVSIVQQKGANTIRLRDHKARNKRMVEDINELHKKLGRPKHMAYYKHTRKHPRRENHNRLMKFYKHFFEPTPSVGFSQCLLGPLTCHGSRSQGSKLYWQIWHNKLLCRDFIREFRCYTTHESLNPSYCYLCEKATKYPADLSFSDWGLDRYITTNSQYYYSGPNIRCQLADTHDFYTQLEITAQQMDNYTARIRARRILELTGEKIGRRSFSRATSNELCMAKCFWFGCGRHGIHLPYKSGMAQP